MEKLNYTETKKQIEESTKVMGHWDHRHVRLLAGISDIAMLTCMGMTDQEGLQPTDDRIKYLPIHFEGDGDYLASIITEEYEAPEHYHLVRTFKHWVKVYDDRQCMLQIEGSKIEIYKAGGYSMLIRIFK